VLWFDAVRLEFFAAAGTQKAISFGLSPVMSALLGVLTGIGGGMTRDILVNEIPHVLRSGLYSVAALAGAAVDVVIGHRLGFPYGVLALAGGALCFARRLVAIKHRWHLPVVHLSAQGRAEANSCREKKDDGTFTGALLEQDDPGAD
jgi:uncharacterized membrane protein YeiH